MFIRFQSVLVLCAWSACGVLACNSDKASGSASAEASAEVGAALIAPTFGGSVVVVGDHAVELAVAENGFVQGLVYDARGKVIAGAEPQLSVALRAKGGARPNAKLAWSEPHARLEGRAQLEAGLSGEPIDVSLELGGQHASATLRDYAILPFARFGGSVLAAGPYAVELLANAEGLSAYVLDASGKARAGADFALKLQLGSEPAFELKWDAARSCYTAALDGKLDLAAQPLRLSLTASGKAYSGAAASLKAVADARADARAQLGAGASARLDVAAPKVDVAAPKLDVALGAGAKAAADGKAQLSAGAKASAGALSKAKASASVQAPSVKVQKAASASVSTKASSTKAPSAKVKAGAGVKAGVRLGF